MAHECLCVRVSACLFVRLLVCPLCVCGFWKYLPTFFGYLNKDLFYIYIVCVLSPFPCYQSVCVCVFLCVFYIPSKNEKRTANRERETGQTDYQTEIASRALNPFCFNTSWPLSTPHPTTIPYHTIRKSPPPPPVLCVYLLAIVRGFVWDLFHILR